MLQRGVGDDATVPEMIRSDFDHRKRRRQRAARQNMLGLDLLLGVVKIDKIAGQDVNGTDRKTTESLVDERKIYQLGQSIAEGRGVVVTCCGACAGQAHPGIGKARLEKARLPSDAG